MTETVEATTDTTRTRYTGPVELTDLGDEAVDVSEINRGRPRVDLTPYERKLKDNRSKNRNIPEGGKHTAWTFVVTNEALSTAKSRIGQAAKNVGVGVTWSDEDLKNGTSKVRVITGKRIEGRGRPAGSRNQPKT